MSLSLRRPDPRMVAWMAILTCVLVVQGVAVSESIVWAGPLVCLLLIGVAVDLPIVPLVGVALVVRVLADDQAGLASRNSAALNPSVMIAVLLILVAAGLLLRRRQALTPIVVIGLGIAVWTGVAALSQGTSTVAMREGVRELSVLAVAAIAYNSRGALSMSVVARIVQVAGIGAALLAVFQLGTGGGADIGGDLRASGTFVHPNSAAIYFALAAVTSLWRYLDHGRGRLDLLFLGAFSVATLATFSLDGFGSLLVMLLAFGALRSGSRRLKLRAAILVGVLLAVFLATPLGSERIASQTSGDLGGEQTRSGSSSSLGWRLYKWKTLIPEWEKAPFYGQGLGTTVTAEATATDTTVGNLPHNEYMRYLVETGALGIALLLTGLFLIARRLNRARKAAVGPAGVATLGLAGLVGLMFNAMAANTLLYTPVAFAAALVLATALRYSAPAPTPQPARPTAHVPAAAT